MLLIFIATEWWFMYGNHAPTLRNLTIKILFQTASSLVCERNWSTYALIHTKQRNCVTPPTRHTMSSKGVIFFYKLITFKLVHSYNVKHLTCTIFCSSGLQNIYKLHIWKCSTFTIFTLLHLFTNNKKDITYTK